MMHSTITMNRRHHTFPSDTFLIRIILLLLILPVAFITSTTAQNSRPMRIEIPVQEEEQPFQVMALGVNGILLYYQVRQEADRKEFKWVFSLYDINLTHQWTRDYPLPEEFSYAFSSIDGHIITLGFQNTSKRGNGSLLSMLFIDIQTATIQSAEESLPEKSVITMAKVMNGYCIVGIQGKDDHSSVLIRKQDGHFRKLITPSASGKSMIKSIERLPNGSGFSLALEHFSSRKVSEILWEHYSFLGTTLRTMSIKPASSGNSLNTLKTVPLAAGTNLVFATYYNQKDKDFSDVENKAEESTGFYTGLLLEDSIIAEHFYNFLSFKNFFNRMRGNQAIYDARSVKKDKEVSSDYRLLLHDVMPYDSGFLLLGEAYYPEYHTITRWTYDYYGHMVPTYYTVFDGYRYNNAFICGFDSSGTLLWENSMEFNDLLTMKLRQRVSLLFDGEEIIMAYGTDGKVASKVIRKNETLDGIEYAALENLDPYDKVSDNKECILSHWYDNTYLSFGYQEIKNARRTDSRRTVFYINKLVFR